MAGGGAGGLVFIVFLWLGILGRVATHMENLKERFTNGHGSHGSGIRRFR